jgi:hypothetical protein
MSESDLNQIVGLITIAVVVVILLIGYFRNVFS